jgi:hypothetical protein
MLLADLAEPLLGSNHLDGESKIDLAAPAFQINIFPPAKQVRFHDPLISAVRTPVIPSSAPLKSALKKTSAIQATDESPLEPTTAGIIQRIQRSYATQRAIHTENQKLRETNKQLKRELDCCDKASCACCLTGGAGGTALSITAVTTTGCSPWAALIAIPFCAAAYFWKKTDDKEKAIHENARQILALYNRPAPPDETMQPSSPIFTP